MQKLNNKGVTLIELIVSFAIVGAAIIYFFQTLTTVNKIYSNSRKETNNYINRDYTYRILDKYIENNTVFIDDKVCKKYSLDCKNVTYVEYTNGINHYKIEFNDGSEKDFYKYKNIMSEFGVKEVQGTAGIDTSYSDIFVHGDATMTGNNNVKIEEKNANINYDVLKIEYWKNNPNLTCSLSKNDEDLNLTFGVTHKVASYDTAGTLNTLTLFHNKNVTYHTCYATIRYIKFSS